MSGEDAPASLLETERLQLRRVTTGDAPFFVELLNDEAFLRNVGDKGVRTVEDAVRHIEEGPIASYARHGFGMYLVESKDSRDPLGICGLLKRDALEHADIGFAFLARHRSRGLASEAAAAVLAHARRDLALGRVLAIVNPDNAASIGVLRKIGFVDGGTARLTPDGPELTLLAADPDTTVFPEA